MAKRTLECNPSAAPRGRTNSASHLDYGMNYEAVRGMNEPESTVDLTDLRHFSKGWLFQSRFTQSPNTLEDKQDVVRLLGWFLDREQATQCGVGELIGFLNHVYEGHREPGGRFGNPQLTKPVTPRTVEYYYVYLKGLFKYLVTEGVIEKNPFERIQRPRVSEPVIQPPSQEEVMKLLDAARNSPYSRRDEAILSLLYDTGIRVSELCSLNYGDIDFDTRRFEVIGKGRKKRIVHFSAETFRVLWNYTAPRRPSLDESLFLSVSGSRPGTGMTREGILQLFERLCRQAKIRRIGPHAFRRACTVALLSNGANVLSVQDMLGHEDLRTTRKYSRMAQAEIAKQHDQFSPLATLRQSGWQVKRRRREW